MTKPTDKEIAWSGRIQDRAATATKAIFDRLAAMPKSGFTNLAPTERRDIQETIAKQIVDTMLALGTFVTAGAQDFQVAHLEQVTIGKGGKIKMVLIPAGDKVNVELLAANADKQAVLAFVNGVAYQQARDALNKAIHREQTDWIHREQDADAEQAEQPTDGVVVATANATLPKIQAHATGDLIADQPGDENGQEQEQPAEDTDGGGDDGGGQDGPRAGAGEADPTAPAEGADSDRDNPVPPARRSRRRADRPAAH